MKKRMLSLICVLALCLGLLPTTALAAGEATKIVIHGVDRDNSITIDVPIISSLGETATSTYQVTATVYDVQNMPMENPDITWTLGETWNNSITVDAKTGLITITNQAASSGHTTLTATCGNAEATVNIIPLAETGPTIFGLITKEGQVISGDSLSIPDDGATTASYTVEVYDHYGIQMNDILSPEHIPVAWSVTDADGAAVSGVTVTPGEEGAVTVSVGNTAPEGPVILTAKFTYMDILREYSITLYLTKNFGASVSISGLDGPKTYGDGPFRLTASVSGQDGTGSTWTWESSDPEVMSVMGSGNTANVTILKAGTANISVNYENNGISGFAFVTVTVNPIDLSGADIQVYRYTAYTGTWQSWQFDVYLDGEKLENPDYYRFVNDAISVKDAGEYTVTVRSNDSNYTGTASTAFTILPRDITNARIVLIGNMYSRPYTGLSQTVSPNCLEVDITDEWGEPSTLTSEAYTIGEVSGDLSGTGAGTYTITLTATDSNFTGTATREWYITPAKLTITGATLAEKTYDGGTAATVTGVTFSGLVNGEGLTLGTDYTATAEFDTADAGTDKTATVTVTLMDEGKAGNYAFADGSKTATFTLTDQTIGKGTYTGPKEVSGSVLAGFPGSVALPAIPAGASYGEPSYSSGDNAVTDLSITGGVLSYTGGSGIVKDQTYTVTVPVIGATNYGNYQITVALTGSDKQVLNITGVTAQDGIYNGQAQTGYTGFPAADGYDGDFTVTYDTTDGKAPTDAGTYIVTIAIPDSDAQYVGSIGLEFTIGKAAVTVIAPSKTIYVGDTIPDLSTLQAIITGLVGNDSFLGVTLAYGSIPDSSIPGTYTIEANGGTFIEGVNGDNYTVSYVNGTLTIEKRPVSGGGTTTPTGPSTGSSDGWSQIEDELEESVPGTTVTVDMNGTTEVPAEAFEAVAGNDVTLKLDMGGGVSWTVNGKDIPENADLTDIDMGVSLNTSTIPVDVLKVVTGEIGTVQMTLKHNGAFGFTMTLTASLGTDNKGLWANLYHYNESDRKMTFETAAKVSADGSVSLPFTHASAYAIVLDEKSHELPFTDTVKGAWYQEAVEYVYRKGIMNGVSATAFKPGATLSRAMVAQILYNLEGQPAAEGESTFTDVGGHWAASPIAWAQERGVLNGYEDNTFRPDRAVSREELARMLYNYAKYKGYDLTAAGDLTVFPDGDDVSDWAEAAMEWANGMGLINGFEDGTLLPGGTATRAQAAVMLTALSMEIAK